MHKLDSLAMPTFLHNVHLKDHLLLAKCWQPVCLASTCSDHHREQAWDPPQGTCPPICKVIAVVIEPCRCTGHGCKFVGSPSEFATHVLHNATNCTRRVWLCDYDISLKVCTVPKLPCALPTTSKVVPSMLVTSTVCNVCKPSLCCDMCSARAARETDWRLV